MSVEETVDARLAALAEDLHERLGDHLIGVGYHHDAEWQPLYMRDDFAERFSMEEMERMADSVILKGLLTSTDESVWGFGATEFKLEQFEDAVIFHFPISNTRGLAVGVDPLPMAALDDVVTPCRDHLAELSE